MISWLSAYLLTVALEMPVWAWGLRRAFPKGWALIGITFGTSLVTHPLLWLAYHSAERFDRSLLLAEGAVATVEGLLVWILWSWKGKGEVSVARCFTISVLANATSTTLGLLVRG